MITLSSNDFMKKYNLEDQTMEESDFTRILNFNFSPEVPKLIRKDS